LTHLATLNPYHGYCGDVTRDIVSISSPKTAIILSVS
jgi:hypothetical protein